MFLRLKFNKKGATVDNIFILISMFGLAIFFITMALFWNVVSTEMDDLWDVNPTTQKIKNDGEALSNQFDFIFTIVWIGFHLGILATVFLLRTHPVIYIASIFIIALLTMIAAPLSNAYQDLDNEAEMSSAKNELTMTNFILTNLPKMEMIWGFITAIVMFGLAKGEGFV